MAMHVLKGNAARRGWKTFLRTCQHTRTMSTIPSADSSDTSSHKPLNIFTCIDFKALKQNRDHFQHNLNYRNISHVNLDSILQIYDDHVRISIDRDGLRQDRKRVAKSKTLSRQDKQVQGLALKHALAQVEANLTRLTLELETQALELPNDTHPRILQEQLVPTKVLDTHGTKVAFVQPPKDHVELLAAHDMADFHHTSLLTGTKFVTLKNDGVMLEQALVQWTLGELSKAGFCLHHPPDLVHRDILSGCGYNPRSGGTDPVYSVTNSSLCLSGTSEMALAGLYVDQILPTHELPLQLAAVSHCFRPETGHGGKASRGLYRLHQFTKVEMFVHCTPDQAEAQFQALLDVQMRLYAALGLHFQVLEMAMDELGAPAYRKIDIEAWMPGRGEFGEISSLSNCTDYQSRRLRIRHYPEGEKKTQYTNTLNGTAMAIPRIMIAILETHQQPDGSIVIPEILRPYMGMKERIGKVLS